MLKFIMLIGYYFQNRLTDIYESKHLAESRLISIWVWYYSQLSFACCLMNISCQFLSYVYCPSIFIWIWGVHMNVVIKWKNCWSGSTISTLFLILLILIIFWLICFSFALPIFVKIYVCVCVFICRKI